MALFSFIGEIASSILGKTVQDFIKEKLAIYKVKKYAGHLSENKDAFIDFLYSNEDKTIFLDINLTHEQNQDMMLTLSNENKNLYFFSLPHDNKEYILGGHSIHIKSNGNDFFYDNRSSSGKVKGHFYVQGFSGPQQGWMSAILIATPKYDK